MRTFLINGLYLQEPRPLLLAMLLNMSRNKDLHEDELANFVLSYGVVGAHMPEADLKVSDLSSLADFKTFASKVSDMLYDRDISLFEVNKVYYALTEAIKKGQYPEDEVQAVADFLEVTEE